MAVFDKSTKIGRSVADPGTDNKLPGASALSFGAISSTGALAGCPGADSKLIQGDQWEMIQGKRQGTITSDWTQTTMGSKTCTVLQNRVTSTLANRNDTIIGSTVQTNVGAAAHTYISNHVVTHASMGMRFEPGTWLHFATNWVLAHSSLKNIGVLYFQFFGVYVSVTPAYGEVRGVYGGYTTVYLHAETFDNQAVALKNRLGAVADKIEAFDCDVVPAELQLGFSMSAIKMAINSICM